MTATKSPPTPHTGSNALCAPPDPQPRPPSRFALPPGAVDTHAHIIGLPPFVEPRGYTSAPVTEQQYLHMLDSVGMSHGVLVQVSIHGGDNSLMLDFLRRHPRRFRGVAVIRHDLPEAGLRELQECGVRGLRLSSVSRDGIGVEYLDRYESVCAEMGWHLQFMSNASHLPTIASRLARLRVPAVIDHMGHFDVTAPGAPTSMLLVRGLAADGAWVKLSGAFRLAPASPYSEVTPYARQLIEAAPDRCVWGSDWPHVNFRGPMPNVGDQLDLLADWAPDEIQRRRILVDNAHVLYGFRAGRS